MSNVITLNQLTLKRSGDGLTIVGRDAHGREHKFTGVNEVNLLKGEVDLVRSGGRVGIAPVSVSSEAGF